MDIDPMLRFMRALGIIVIFALLALAGGKLVANHNTYQHMTQGSK